MAEMERDAERAQWTNLDQARVDDFERQILAVAARWSHSDVIVLAFVQVLGNLMRQRLQAAPERLPTYQRYLAMLGKHVDSSVIPDLQLQQH